MISVCVCGFRTAYLRKTLQKGGKALRAPENHPKMMRTRPSPENSDRL